MPMLTRPFLIQVARNYSLSPEQIEVFIPKILDHHSYEQLATQLGISKASCLKRMGEVYRKFEILGSGRGKDQRLRKYLLELSSRDFSPPQSALGQHPLAQPLREWFNCLQYKFEDAEVLPPSSTNHFEWILNIKARRGFDRIVVHGIQGEAQVSHIHTLSTAVVHHNADEGWVVAPRRVSQLARIAVGKPENKNLFCYTFDELIDEEVNFDNYFDWLEQEIKDRDIATKYVDLACQKAEYDPITKATIDHNQYGKDEGWIDGYIDLWLDDPTKEHISILGEFGTGKTWFTLHYASIALQRYQNAKARGLDRPRMPILIPLRNCAKAVQIESIFLDFFFREHKVLLPDYSVFEQLNRMGKLLLIFDGFDEMATKIDHQSMVNNFWELARVVVPGSKAILTCRTEHFPNAKQGRTLLNAELEASTAKLTFESPRFEVLELREFDDEQIHQVLATSTDQATILIFMSHPELLTLARRPLMIELILDALPDIEAGNPIDLARIYLYTVRRKMGRDIRSDRTFTSLADKLYFLCEVSWEMFSQSTLSLSYKDFPQQIRDLFGKAVQTKTDLDHWHYDMMGQTMLIRNEYGQYTPAHKTFLEFFVAYKLVAELGCLADDFVGIAQQQSHIDSQQNPINYQWSTFFQRQSNRSGEVIGIAPLQQFEQESLSYLQQTLGQRKLTQAITDFMIPMLSLKDTYSPADHLVYILSSLKGEASQDGQYLAGNLITLLLKIEPPALRGYDLKNTVIWGADFTEANLQGTDFTGSELQDCSFPQPWGGDLSVTFSPHRQFVAIAGSTGSIFVWDINAEKLVWQRKGHTDWIRSVAFDASGQILATGSHDKTIKLWSVLTGEHLKTLENGKRVYSVAFSQKPNSGLLASSGDEAVVKLWDTRTDRCRQKLEGHHKWIGVVTFGLDQDGKEILVSGSDDHTIRLWEPNSGACLQVLTGHTKGIHSISFDITHKILASGSADKTIKLWNLETSRCIRTLTGHQDGVRSVSFSPEGARLASGSNDKTIRLWNTQNGQCLKIIGEHNTRVWSVAFSPDNTMLASGGDDKSVKLWDVQSGQCLKSFGGSSRGIWSLALGENGQTLFAGCDDHSIYHWTLDEQQSQRFSTKEHTSRVRAIALYEKANLLVSGSDDKTIKLWDTQARECVATLPPHHEDWIWSVAISPDGQILASGSLDTTVMIWNLAKGQHDKTLSEHSEFVWSVAWHPTAPLIASGSADKTIKLWDLGSGNCLYTLTGHEHQVTSVAFSPTEDCLASGSDDETIRLWNLQTGQCQAVFKESKSDKIGQLRTIAFSPDGQFLASGGLDNVVRVWQIHTGKCIQKIYDHTAPILSLAFSPDGQRLVSGGEAGVILLSDLKSGKTVMELQLDSPYKGMNITNVNGLDNEQKSALMALGAVC